MSREVHAGELTPYLPPCSRGECGGTNRKSRRQAADDEHPLEEHIRALWEATWKSLKRSLNVNVLCGYRGNSQMAGFQVAHECPVVSLPLRRAGILGAGARRDEPGPTGPGPSSER